MRLLISEAYRKMCDMSLPEHEAWRLLSLVTEKDRALLIRDWRRVLGPLELERLLLLLEKRISAKVPLAYLEGSVSFCELSFMVQAPVLIPRPETEEMAWWLIHKIQQDFSSESASVLDVGTGSGCIALSLAVHCPWIEVAAVDCNKEALDLAKKNKNMLQAMYAIAPCDIRESVYFEALLEKKFDIIVSNPPYITEKEFALLDDEVRLWEDHGALVAQENGFVAYRKILEGAQGHKKHDRPLMIVFELGTEYLPLISLFKTYYPAGLYDVFDDMQGKKRWFMGVI